MIMEADDYPRVLFITPCAFNRSTGGGITFGNLFAGWPKDRLATVHNDPIPVTTDVCDKYFPLGSRELRKWFPRSRSWAASASTSTSSGSRALAGTFALRAATSIKRLIFENGLPEKGVLSRELKIWVNDFQPDLIYTILGSNGILELVSLVKKQIRVPLAIHIMDDWPSSIYEGGFLSGMQRRTMRRLLSELLQEATLRIAICDVMAKSYEARYGVPFLSFQNTIDLTRWDRSGEPDVAAGKTFRMLYIGSILESAQLESLVDCCRAVAELNREGKPISFEIFSPDSPVEAIRERVTIHPSISLNGAITDDELFFATLADADLLVLPVNFDRRSIRYIRYSMPTKVPAYLISGTPILVYGPTSVAQVDYAVREGWGEVVSRHGVESLKDAIVALWQNQERRLHLSLNARRVARRNHDSRIVRTGFQQALVGSASGKGVLA